MKRQIKTILPIGLAGVLLAVLSAYLLRGDVWTFWTWWLLTALMGLIAMPVTGQLFAGFADRGWMFSKVLAIGSTGFLTWFLVAVGILPFTMAACLGVCVVCAAGCFLVFYRQSRREIECFPVNHIRLVCVEELIFFGIFLLWTYLAGFHPQAYGTEKFMDYGFMEAMMRSTTLPARDLWYSEGTINYYYGGQYFAVFLTKLSGSKVEITYNLMRTFVAGLAFALPFSLVYQMTFDRLKNRTAGLRTKAAAVSGLLAGSAVSLAGNMHYVVYAWILPLVNRLRGVETDESFWFPDSTRYIGFEPDVPDKTIHEFPSYSFVLGDLHAHVVNIMFVLLLLGILYAWMKRIRAWRGEEECVGASFWKRELLMPHILLAAALLGMFQWTNYWDFVIYFVVTGGVVLFGNIIRFRGAVKKVFLTTAAQAAEVLLVSFVVILPFNLKFETMVQGVALAQYHSLPHQLLLLWGLPVCLIVVFLLSVMLEKRSRIGRWNVYRILKSTTLPDLFAVIAGLCAMGLVLIPELVYVRDIYENGNARANTMFKLTYQAYILFGITMGYVLVRLFFVSGKKIYRMVSVTGLVLLLWTMGYFGNSVNAWFGDVWDPSKYQGLNATTYLETDFSEDAAAVRWLKANVEGSPVVLEANGDSYTGFERVSAATGLPTVLGWYVHEWLWRNDTDDLNQKSGDVESIYTSADRSVVEELLARYEISYIFVGSKEREKYGERLNEELLKSLGTVVFADENSSTYILKVQ